MNPLHIDYLATQHIADMHRDAATTSYPRRDDRAPAPPRQPLPPFPRLIVGRLITTLRHLPLGLAV
jgi:hypothetical protein